MAEQVNLINTIAQAGQTAAKQQRTQVDILKLMDDQQAAAAEQGFAIDEMLGAKKVISSQEEAFKATTDAKKAAAEVAFSSDFTDQASKTNYWAREVHENAAKAYSSLDAINEKKKSNLLEDPIGYIMNQFTLPSDIAAHNYYVQKHNVADNALNELIQGTTAAATMANQMQKSTSAELALAKLGEVEAQAKSDKARLAAQTAGTRISGLQVINSIDMQQSSLAFQTLGAVNADAHLKIAAQNAADSHAMRMMQQEKFRQDMENKADDRDTVVALMNNYNVGARLALRPEIADIKTFQRLFASNNKNPEFMNVISAGQQVEMQGGKIDGVGIAKNAGDTAAMYAKSGPLVKGNDVATYMSSVYNQLKTDPTAPKEVTAFNAFADKRLFDNAKSKLSSIKDSEPNIYAAPPLDVMMKSKATQQIVTSNPFFAGTIMPMYEANKSVKVDDSLIASKAAEFVLQNPANLKATAAGAAAYYKQATLVNNTFKRFEANGLPIQQKYMWDSDSGTMDLTSETAWSAYLMRSYAQNKIVGFDRFASVN